MSYRGKYSGGDSSRRYSSTLQRDAPPRYQSRRSPSPVPQPRDPKQLPEAFGRQPDQGGQDDDLNILQRMKTAYASSPLADLYECIRENRKIKIWTRNFKEVRGIIIGYLVAFDKHWNLILKDADEVYLKPKKSKTPFLRNVKPNESLPDMPIKVPKEKKSPNEQPPQPGPKPADSEKKKKKQKKKSKTTSAKRQVDKIFVRGDNIVMICTVYDTEEVQEIKEEEDSDIETICSVDGSEVKQEVKEEEESNIGTICTGDNSEKEQEVKKEEEKNILTIYVDDSEEEQDIKEEEESNILICTIDDSEEDEEIKKEEEEEIKKEEECE